MASIPQLNTTDYVEILSALDLAQKSAKRGQNTGRTPQLKAVWEAQERGLAALIVKVQQIMDGGK